MSLPTRVTRAVSPDSDVIVGRWNESLVRTSSGCTDEIAAIRVVARELKCRIVEAGVFEG